MAVKRPKIVIIGAGMAGVTAAHKLYTAVGTKESFELCVVEGGQRIGGRINTREFVGDRIEMGATWIHGIGGSPVYEIAQKIKSLESEKPWECMDGLHEERLSMAETRTEGGFVVNPAIVEPISSLFDNLMSFAQGKSENGVVGGSEMSSIGSFLKLGLEKYLGSKENGEDVTVCGNWSRKMLEEAVFAVYENTQRTYTGAGDLFNLDYAAESEYRMFPGDEITIPRGYLTIVEALASVLPPGLIQLGRKVVKIEWQQNGDQFVGSENGNHSIGDSYRPVKLHFSDGSIMLADHVIVTVSLGVLKATICDELGGLFSPSLPSLKKEAISRLGFGVVNKLFLELSTPNNQDQNGGQGIDCKFPFMQMAFHRSDSKFKDRKIPWWMRRTASIYPIHSNSSVLLSWFAGKEALELESLDDEAIIEGVSTTVSSFVSKLSNHSHDECNGNGALSQSNFEFKRVLRSKWGTDPLFLGSYSYVSVRSSGDDFDTLAQPLPMPEECGLHPLQILFAGEATHRTHYSTTHGAYYSGLREANRLLQQYNLVV
ncbi:putative polyamine oxidase 5 [Silene latifolia]|uniref:putative polyamine oxidase 5 n=1 Tax=Silene latifolia TaxID=37657 RepID=UPI003D787037